MSTIELIIKYREGFLNGLSVTLHLCGIVWILGLVVGSALAVLGASDRGAWVGRISRGLSFVLSGVPILVLLFWLHYPAQSLMNVVIDPFYTAAFALSLVNVFAVADALRPVLEQFPREYITVARVCGLSPFDVLWNIQAPLIIRRVAPTLLILQVNVLHATLFASLISVEEIFRVSQRINAKEYMPVEIYTALAVFFLIVCLPLNACALLLRHRFQRNLSER